MNKKGSVLMISLWILAILVLFALGLGQRAAINLRLARYQRDRLKASYLAKAGINSATSLLKEDATDSATKDYDTTTECGVNLKGKEAKEMFSQDWNDGAQGFNVGYYDSSGTFVYGMRDEESKININKADKYQLQQLFTLRGFDADASGITNTVIDWIDSDVESEETKEIFKNDLLKTTEELLVIFEYFYEQSGRDKKESQQKAQEVFSAVKDYVTVYGSGKVNINTVSYEVLQIISYSALDSLDKTDYGPADTLISKIQNERDGDDSLATFDDAPFQNSTEITTRLGFQEGSDEDAILDKIIFSVKSENFRIESTGTLSKISKKITAIYERLSANGKIVYWHEN